MKLGPSKIALDTDNQMEFVAFVQPADPAFVEKVLAADEESPDGRSQFMWVRLQDGTLILGVFPQGDTYFLTEADLNRP